jgi:hypothetical protein
MLAVPGPPDLPKAAPSLCAPDDDLLFVLAETKNIHGAAAVAGTTVVAVREQSVSSVFTTVGLCGAGRMKK